MHLATVGPQGCLMYEMVMERKVEAITKERWLDETVAVAAAAVATHSAAAAAA